MSVRRNVAMLAVGASVACAATVRAQAPGDRVRVHLLGLRLVEDTVMSWTSDSLVGRHGLAVSRSQIMSLDVWRPRPFLKSWMRFGGLGIGATSFLERVSQSRSSASPAAPQQKSMVATIAIGVGVGLAAAIVERALHLGEWVAIAEEGAPHGPPPGAPPVARP